MLLFLLCTAFLLVIVAAVGPLVRTRPTELLLPPRDMVALVQVVPPLGLHVVAANTNGHLSQGVPLKKR